MRITTALTAAAVAGALTDSLIAATEPASAATRSHYVAARADWEKGAHVAVAARSRHWSAAHHQLTAYGKRDAHEISDLAAIIEIPATDTTAAQPATAARLTRELLLGVRQGSFDPPACPVPNCSWPLISRSSLVTLFCDTR